MESISSEKIKKYLFFVSIVFLVAIIVHLSYKYIYDDAQATPVKGGTLSEGIIGTSINLNPLISTNDENRTILKLVYRSLLKYNPENGNFEKDLASCEIKNLKNIECFIEEGQKWSDGSEIEIDDIFKTYTRLKEIESQETIYPLLQDITISTSDKKIVFSSESNDINTLKILLQPILEGNMVEAMPERDVTGTILNPINMVFSGPYTISSVTNDETTGIKTVTLNRNLLNTDNEYHLDKLSFRFFDDPAHLLKYKSRINVFNDTENILGEYSPRIQTFEYKLPKITSVFINTDTITDKNFRGFLLEKIQRDDIIKVLGPSFSKAMNPLGTPADTTNSDVTKDLASLIAEYEYYSKSKIVDYLLTDEQKEIFAEEEAERYKENPKLEYAFTPYTNKYNFIQKDNVLLKGNVDAGTVAVYINDYKLTGFSAGDKQFFYRLEEKSYETIEQGINTFKIIFEDENGEKVEKTELIVAYNPDADVLRSYKDELLGLEDTNTYSNEVNIKQLSSEERDIKDKLDALDDNFFYNRDLEKFSLSLAYITGNINIEKTAEILKNTIETFGISVILNPITSTTLAENIAAGNNEYDMILVGLSLGYFDHDLFPYLHSSQVKTGYNISNFKKSSLDESLELLRTSGLSDEEERTQRDNIISILQEEQILKSIYQPTERLLVDKNIKNFKFWEYLPNYNERINYIRGIYILENKAPQFEEKSISGFIGFLLTQLF